MSLQTLIDSLVLDAALLEGVMDKETTMISRLAVQKLKSFIGSSKSTKLKKTSLEFETTVNGSPLDVLIQVLPMKLSNTLKAGSGEFQTYRYKSDPKQGAVLPSLPNDKLVLNVIVPLDRRVIENSQWEPFVLTFKSVIRHELEHSRQKARSNKTALANPTSFFGAELDTEQIFVDPEAALRYYTSPHEVEAYVMQIYRTAKMKKIPFTKALKEYITGSLGQNILRGMGVAKGIKVLNTIKKAWLDYASKRLPGVV